jgi:putative FmdB family regulatory protein
MPLYDYRCRDCGEIFEKLRRMHEADHDVQCPKCHSENVERMLSSFATSGGCGSGSGGGRFR